MIEQFLTTEQVANILQVHPFTILKFLKEGKLKGIKLGRVYRIKESDVHEFLENRSTGKGKHDARPKGEQNETHIEHLARDQEIDKTSEPFSLERDKKREEGPHYYII